MMNSTKKKPLRSKEKLEFKFELRATRVSLGNRWFWKISFPGFGFCKFQQIWRRKANLCILIGENKENIVCSTVNWMKENIQEENVSDCISDGES
jgi:hypothetical protein